MEDVVEALELAGPLEGEDVERLLDDAQPRCVAARVAADRAERRVADVEAALAEDDLVADGDERGGQRPRLGVGRAEEVVGQPLGGLRADAGQPGERLDQPRDGLDDGAWPRAAPAYMPGRRRPPVTAAIFCSASSRDARSASLTAATTRSWSISTSSGSTADGSIVTRDELLLAGHGRADDAAAGRAVDRGSARARPGRAASPAASAAPSAAGWPCPSGVLLSSRVVDGQSGGTVRRLQPCRSAAGQLTSPTSTMSSAKIRRASART